MFMWTWDYRGFLIEPILALLEHIFDPKIRANESSYPPPSRQFFGKTRGGVAGDLLPPSAAAIHIVYDFSLKLRPLDTPYPKNFGACGGLSSPIILYYYTLRTKISLIITQAYS